MNKVAKLDLLSTKTEHIAHIYRSITVHVWVHYLLLRQITDIHNKHNRIKSFKQVMSQLYVYDWVHVEFVTKFIVIVTYSGRKLTKTITSIHMKLSTTLVVEPEQNQWAKSDDTLSDKTEKKSITVQNNWITSCAMLLNKMNDNRTTLSQQHRDVISY